MNAHQTREQLSNPKDWSWPFWPLMPLYPYGKRRTLRKEVVKSTIWTFDQIQGVLYVIAPIRMTVVKLEEGGLLVYAPVAPTRECIRLVKELVAEHGEVKYIVLPTVSGLEHKVFVGPFARRFPTAQVFVAPHQWSFPLNLPLSWLGFPLGRTNILPEDSSQAPFADQFDYAILGPIGVGQPYEEVAFFHRSTCTLLVIDAIVSISEDPPDIVQLDPFALLFHAKDSVFDVVEDTEANRRKGWQRISLFTYYFQPSALEVIGFQQMLRDARKAPDRSKKAFFGCFPFRWKPIWKQSFETLRGEGRPFVAPILQALILNRAPQQTLEWVDKIARWNFQRIIPCHSESPLEVGPQQFRQAFAFLEKNLSLEHKNYLLPEADFELLRKIEKALPLPPAP
jgi:hypothetical protein